MLGTTEGVEQKRPKRVLITGTSYGIGAAISEALTRRSDLVFGLSRTSPPPGQDSVWLKADLEDIALIPDVVDQLTEMTDGGFDGVVFNAALADKSRSQWSAEQVERHFRLNALAPFALWMALEERDLIGRPCNVVLMGSFLQNGNIRQPAYAMSKAALWAWMRSFTMNQASDDPVTMNMVWPGRVKTPANPVRELPTGDPNHFYSPERIANVVIQYLDQTPGGPRGTVVDMGRS